MSDNKFYVSVWGIVCVTILTIILSFVFYFNNYNKLITKMVLNGTDPIETMCILKSHSNPVCIILASKNKEE